MTLGERLDIRAGARQGFAMSAVRRFVTTVTGSGLKAGGRFVLCLNLLEAVASSMIHHAHASNEPRYVLAASWQPAFCETRPRKPECRSQTETLFDARYFSLHGLWPQPRANIYCGVSARDRQADKRGRWDRLPALRLSPETRAELDEVMPGTQSLLQRHEWIKHGTCHDGDAEDYYRDSLRLMAALNASGVQDLFEASIGKRLSAQAVRAAFDAAFGPGAGARVKLSCVGDGGRRLIREITIGLKGALDEEARFADLILAAPPTSPGCPGGIVDPVGLQ